MTEKPTIILCEQDTVDQLAQQVDGLLKLLGYSLAEVLVTDESQFLDFMCMFTYPTLEKCEAYFQPLLSEAGIADVGIAARDKIGEAAIKVAAKYPNWPADNTPITPTVH